MPRSVADRKDYLSNLLCDLGFSEEAKRALGEAFDRIFARQDAAERFEAICARFEKNPDEKFFYLIEASDSIAAGSGLSRYEVYLVVLLLLSESSKKVYAERGVSAEMWRSNLLDLRYQCETCFLVRGVYGTDCPEWCARFFAATRFTFGILQFETGRLGKAFQKNGVSLSPDAQVIYIHIPRSGARLTPAAVDASCAAASAFFKERCGIKDVIFACHSWILYPENEKIFPETSNLRSFLSRFEILRVEEDAEYKEFWRIFDKIYNGNADDLPQDTSLRRAYAKRAKEKKPLGVALGVWVYKE